uniref:Leucine permease transcriptional regulator n=1 Tax=Colletotrichum fructicola (strain Nara gc5) TaxID=1213859 RepID=L2G5V7_COLFN
MTSVSFPPSRPDRTSSPFGASSSGGFGGKPFEHHYGSGLDGAGAGGGKRSKRNHKTQPVEMTTLSTKRKGVNPFGDGASSDDNRRRKNTKTSTPGDWKKKTAQAAGARSNGATRGAKGFGADSTDYETDDANGGTGGDGTPYSERIFAQLKKDGIAPPKWPADPGNTKQKAAMAKFREDYKTYRDRARTSLMRAGLIDDPDKPKRLEDAIDFKGICDAMCPDFEKITRITEFDVQFPEKNSATTFAVTSKMVKKLARSAAGQEAPLPMDVRSTAALRKTLDYLIDDLLQTDDNLPVLHGFLWDRTRAIRRDFIFHSTMAPAEMKDQVYCLETIARFHVTSLHLLSQEGFRPEDFSEQQEIEQLGKALLSLMFAYDDCKPHGVICENEPEFRAYHLLFSANKPNILDDVQKEWGDSRFWADSDEIRTAVSLVESLQSSADFHGPLGSAPSMAVSAAHRTYFKIVESRQVSYTMACFAEIHLGQLRRSALRSLKKAYTRPRHGAKDITPSALNRFLNFDTEAQAVEFAEQHGLTFVDGESPSGELVQYLDTSSRLTWPRIQHSFSRNLVERKRGSRSLPEVIHSTIPDESSPAEQSPFASTNNGLFVSDASKPAPKPVQPVANGNGVFKSPFSATSGATPTNPAGASPFDKEPTSAINRSACSEFFRCEVESVCPAQSSAWNFNLRRQSVRATSATEWSLQTFCTRLSFVCVSWIWAKRSAKDAGSRPDRLTAPSTDTSSPAITVTPPTPQFSLGGASGGSKPPSPFARAAAGAPSAASPFSGISLQPPVNPAESTQPPLPTQSAPAPTQPPIEQPKPTPAQSPFSGLTSATPQLPKVPSPAPPPGQSPLPTFNFQPSDTPPTPKQVPAPQASPFPAAPATTSTPAPDFTPAPLPKPPVAAPLPKQDVMGDFAKWFVKGDNGLIHEFEKFMVEQIVSDAFEKYHREEEERIRKEEEEKALAEAREFRVRTLSVRYFYQWKKIARNLRLSKIRRHEREEMRRIQKEMREEEMKKRKKAARVAEARRKLVEQHGVDPVEELREILQLKKDDPPEDLQAEAEALFATGIFSGVTDEHTAATGHSLSKSVSAKPGGAKTQAIRAEFGSSVDFRRSLPPMSAHSASSRYTPSEASPKRVSKVSDRWRLKAMGLVTMPNGSALPEAIADEMRYNGKRYSGLGSFGLDRDTTERRRSVSADLDKAAEARRRFSQSLNSSSAAAEQSNGNSQLSKRKRPTDSAASPSQDARAKKRPSSNAEVERIIREARENLESLRSSRVDLDEGTEWFREQNDIMQAEEASRASSPWPKGRN